MRFIKHPPRSIMSVSSKEKVKVEVAHLTYSTCDCVFSINKTFNTTEIKNMRLGDAWFGELCNKTTVSKSETRVYRGFLSTDCPSLHSLAAILNLRRASRKVGIVRKHMYLPTLACKKHIFTAITLIFFIPYVYSNH